MTCPDCGRHLDDDYCAVCGYKAPARMASVDFKRHIAELRETIRKAKPQQ